VTIFVDSPPRGLLVTVDGPNGAGKTSLAAAVAAELAAAGETVHTTRQPSPTPLGDTVRAAEREVKRRALACLVAGDRHHQAETEIIPKLTQGAIVLCDRYVESSLVLQRLDGVEIEYILAINAGIPRPSLRIRLLARPEVLAKRLAQRGSPPERRIERSGGPERELELYAEADRLLVQREQLPATTFDTSSTNAQGLGVMAAELILSMR
jgi:dTMP kinase